MGNILRRAHIPVKHVVCDRYRKETSTFGGIIIRAFRPESGYDRAVANSWAAAAQVRASMRDAAIIDLSLAVCFSPSMPPADRNCARPAMPPWVSPLQSELNTRMSPRDVHTMSRQVLVHRRSTARA